MKQIFKTFITTAKKEEEVEDLINSEDVGPLILEEEPTVGREAEIDPIGDCVVVKVTNDSPRKLYLRKTA